ncbi:MAG: CheY-like chemotaxis protein [Saprospiraceae bacterium]|jgi:CheY-like chemotaxis protein
MRTTLVIEDNYNIRENLWELLELSNFHVTTASNGLRGIDSLRSETPDLIIYDVSIPEMNGYQVLEFVKSKPETAKILFMFVTSIVQKKEIEKGVLSGADSYLTKPLKEAILFENIEGLLDYNVTGKIVHSPYFVNRK